MVGIIQMGALGGFVSVILREFSFVVLLSDILSDIFVNGIAVSVDVTNISSTGSCAKEQNLEVVS